MKKTIKVGQSSFQSLIDEITCSKYEDVIQLIPDKSIDLVVSDPPYQFISKNMFMKFENKKHLDKIRDAWGSQYNPIPYLNECKRILKKFNGYFFTNKTLLKTYIQFAEDNNYKFDILIWHKPNPLPLHSHMYCIDKEYIVYIHETGAAFNSKLGYDKYHTVFRHPIGGKGVRMTDHPTEKPLFIIKNLIEVSSNPGDVIFDGYAGSGTIAVACALLDRHYICVEMEQKWIDVSENRVTHLNEEKFKNAKKN